MGPATFGPRQNTLALISMIVGILSALTCGFCGAGAITAVVLGFIARGQIAGSNGQEKGSGMALAGIITGFIGLAEIVIYALIMVVAAAAGNTGN